MADRDSIAALLMFRLFLSTITAHLQNNEGVQSALHEESIKLMIVIRAESLIVNGD